MTSLLNSLDLDPKHLVLVQQIMSKHIPGHEVVVFGSRANGTARKYSDLDLAIFASSPLSIDLLLDITEEFGESDLPFKVDVVDGTRIDESFRRKIRRNCISVFS